MARSFALSRYNHREVAKWGTTSSPPFFLRDSRASETRARVKITPRQEGIREAFITGLRSPSIRQRLLKNNTLDLKDMFGQARSLELVLRNSESYSSSLSSVNAAVPPAAPGSTWNLAND